MCIMEVRTGQRTGTIVQACTHNLSTVERDLDMLEPLLEARGENVELAQVRLAHESLRTAYGYLLTAYAREVDREVQMGHAHPHEE